MERKVKGMVLDWTALQAIAERGRAARLVRPCAVSAITVANSDDPPRVLEVCRELGIEVHPFTAEDAASSRLDRVPAPAQWLAIRLGWDLLTNDTGMAERSRRLDLPVVMLEELAP